MRRSWRVDPWQFRQVFTAFMLAVGGAFAVTLVAVIVQRLGAGAPGLRDAAQIAAGLGFLAVWLTFVVRLHLTGVYVNDRGVRLRHVFRTRTLPWAEVTGFEVRAARLLGGPTVRAACWVRTLDGRVETPVQLRSRTMGLRKENGPVLSRVDFDRMVERLTAELAAARRRAAGQVEGGGVVSR
ncbi:PH domain-containing protein [Micromonospora sp. GCM10011542]|uniref:PH domain-containing protein n=1 Tax=Micromonospora sp. GCM10011542 TaxID=3317337 RepID=UPI00361D35CA